MTQIYLSYPLPRRLRVRRKPTYVYIHHCRRNSFSLTLRIGDEIDEQYVNREKMLEYVGNYSELKRWGERKDVIGGVGFFCAVLNCSMEPSVYRATVWPEMFSGVV